MPKANKRRWAHPQKRSEKYACELKAGVHCNRYGEAGDPLTRGQKAYRAGYLERGHDEAEMYKFKKRKALERERSRVSH